MPGVLRTTRHPGAREGSVGFFHEGTRAATPDMIAFIDQYRDSFTTRVHVHDVELVVLGRFLVFAW